MDANLRIVFLLVGADLSYSLKLPSQTSLSSGLSWIPLLGNCFPTTATHMVSMGAAILNNHTSRQVRDLSQDLKNWNVIDCLAGFRVPGWKSFFFRTLRALLIVFWCPLWLFTKPDVIPFLNSFFVRKSCHYCWHRCSLWKLVGPLFWFLVFWTCSVVCLGWVYFHSLCWQMVPFNQGTHDLQFWEMFLNSFSDHFHPSVYSLLSFWI